MHTIDIPVNTIDYYKIKPKEIMATLDIPAGEFSAVRDNEAGFIYEFISDKGLKRTLEIGFAYGKSGAHIMAATNATHIAIDPFQESDYGSQGLRNIEKLQCIDNLTFYCDYSHNVLPHLLKENKTFQFIFIDGDHKFDGILVDFYFSDMMLEKNGYILLHDTWLRSTCLVEEFIRSNRKDYQYIPSLKNFSLFQKVGEDSRTGMYFSEFYTLKSFLNYRLINWISKPTTLIKRMLLRPIVAYLNNHYKN